MGRKPKKEKTPWESLALVVREGEKPFAILVDDILGQQQVVIKRLGTELKNVPGLAGGAILGDGRAALIVDLAGLTAARNKTSGRGA
jgi:two-component system chemotaxis sensor kinase CheA